MGILGGGSVFCPPLSVGRFTTLCLAVGLRFAGGETAVCDDGSDPSAGAGFATSFCFRRLAAFFSAPRAAFADLVVLAGDFFAAFFGLSLARESFDGLSFRAVDAAGSKGVRRTRPIAKKV